jgi:hypothetical protein
MSKKTLAALALITFSGAALAGAPAFAEVDIDQNGMISVEEATVVEGLDFSKADANGDGALDEAEWGAATAE